MAALTKVRNTLVRSQGYESVIKVAAATKILAGGGVCINASGYAVSAADATGLRYAGRAEETCDNTAGSNGDLSVKVRKGVHKWVNGSAGAAIAQAQLKTMAHVVDDQTVGKTSTHGVVAGVIEEIDADGGIWVNSLDVQALSPTAPIPTVTVGAIDPNKRTTFLSIDGTKAFSLAAGSYEGQRVSLRCTVAANTPAGTLTPSAMPTGTTLAFNAVEDAVELEYHATGGWHVVLNQSVVIA